MSHRHTARLKGTVWQGGLYSANTVSTCHSWHGDSGVISLADNLIGPNIHAEKQKAGVPIISRDVHLLRGHGVDYVQDLGHILLHKVLALLTDHAASTNRLRADKNQCPGDMCTSYYE